NSTAVGMASASDADLPVQAVNFSITGGADQARFSITNSGLLKFITAPDFEVPTDAGTDNIYNVQITANDGNGGLTVQNIVVTVTPVNDNLPVFTSAATFNVTENSTVVGTTVATDADFPVQPLFFSITGGSDQAKFSITTDGLLNFIAVPDFEIPTDVGLDNIYNVQVTADDGAGGLTIQNIAVTVTPANDNIPVFTGPAAFNVVENSTSVGSVVATDADVPMQLVTYSITGGADQAQFSITNAGALSFVTPPDFENPTDAGPDHVYNVQVTANDGQGGLAIQNIAVTVTPANDNVPVFTSLAAFNIPENSTTVGTILANDADLPLQTLSYSISGGVDQAKFAITSGGLLTFVSAPDYEHPTDSGFDNVYHVQISANDGNGGLTVQNITVTVLPTNDNVPVFTSPAVFSIPENTTAVGIVAATDADVPVQMVSFTISGGVDQASFAITNAGVLTFVAAPDFENPTDAGTNNVYNLQVTASDGQGGVTVQNIAVTVSNIDEVPTLLLGGPDVTWINKKPPVAVLPQITVGGLSLAGGTLTISVNAIGNSKKLLDHFVIPSSAALGTSTGAHFANGKLTQQIQLGQAVTSDAIQSFLRGLTFSTKGKGLKAPSRTLNVTLADAGGLSAVATQVIHVRKKA
ncbi:MAG: Cadherin domain protein, partial [Planctomycetaceae bacterium]|nr:Cadherin domain protein [Planctomycetaceae bacterium]